jgi:hypothetical protein
MDLVGYVFGRSVSQSIDLSVIQSVRQSASRSVSQLINFLFSISKFLSENNFWYQLYLAGKEAVIVLRHCPGFQRTSEFPATVDSSGRSSSWCLQTLS